MANTLKDPELQKYYDEFLATMNSPGWKLFLEDVAKADKDYSDIGPIGNVEMLYFRKGQLDILRWIAGHKDFVERAYDMLLEEEQS